MAAEHVGGNACGQTPTYVNTSCALPPDAVNVTWLVQSIVAIEDIRQARRRAARAREGRTCAQRSAAQRSAENPFPLRVFAWAQARPSRGCVPPAR
jgi:hypothetical protein